MVGRRSVGTLFKDSSAAHTPEGASPFTTVLTGPPPVAEVLAREPVLLPFVPMLEDAAIDTELATEMTAAELLALLPADTPIGHALRLRKLCAQAVADSAIPRARIPLTPAWQQPARIIAAGTQQGDLSGTVRNVMDIALIVSSLFLTMTLEQLLDCPELCSDGSSCNTLRSVDAILWALATGCFIGGVLSAWINIVFTETVSMSHRAVFFSDNWDKFALPTGLAITGVSTLPFALVTRLLIGAVGGPTFSAAIKWSAFATIVSLPIVGGWVHHVALARRALGIKWSEFPSFQGVVMGIRLPRGDAIGAGAECKHDLPYFDDESTRSSSKYAWK